VFAATRRAVLAGASDGWQRADAQGAFHVAAAVAQRGGRLGSSRQRPHTCATRRKSCGRELHSHGKFDGLHDDSPIGGLLGGYVTR